MKGCQFLILLVLGLAVGSASAYDPSPLQDFCVAMDDPLDGGVYVFIQVVLAFVCSPNNYG